VDRIGKVRGDKIRFNGPIRGIPKIFTFAVTGADQDTACAGAPGKLDVAVTIADHERSMQVDGVLPSCPFEHTRFWLAAIAAVGRGVRTKVYGVETRAGGCELLGHEFVDRVDERFRKVPAANAGLICHHNHRKPSLIQAADGFSDPRQDTKSVDVIQVADFFGNGAVTIEKNGGAENSGFSQDAPLATKSSVARQPRRRPELRESYTCDRSGSGGENTGCSMVFPERWCNAE
jgi:hypothetical protein